jgi:hypothetical protein
MEDKIHNNEEDHGNLSDREQDSTNKPDRERKPLPENVAEYIQKVRDELKEYEEHKKYYEKKRKREIVLELVDLLEEHDYPKEWLRLIIAQELGDYISTSYIEKILSERYPNEKKKVKEQSTRQITEIPRNDDRIHIEVSTTGESIGDDDHLDNIIPNSYDTDHKSSEEARTEFKTDLELQAEEGRREIVRALQKQVSELQAKCYLLDQLAQERSMWEEKCTQLQRELVSYKSKIINGTAEIEFGSEFLPVQIEYHFKTNQFSARVPGEAIERVLGVLRRQG